MKFIKSMAFSAVIFIVIFIVAYMIMFHDSPISGDPDNWNHFGGYLGGTVGPFLSFLGLIAVLYTIHIQSLTLKHMQSATDAQQDYLNRKEKKDEWLAIIKHTEDQIKAHIATEVIKNGKIIGNYGSLINALYNLMDKEGMLNDVSYAKSRISQISDNVELNHLYPLSSTLLGLADYLIIYKELVSNDDKKAIMSHYVSTYFGWYTRLNAIGVMNDNCKNKISELLK